MSLPELPRFELDELEDLSPPQDGGFLRLRRRQLRLRYPDGRVSSPFVYDNVDRPALDAVVVAAHYNDTHHGLMVYLRSAIRPPAQLRPLDRRPVPEKASLGSLWELPAGLVEANEYSDEGLKRCAARETAEELGFDVPSARYVPLGPSSFPSAGVIGERFHFFRVEVAPTSRGIPSEDGSVLEQGALIAPVSLSDALEQVRLGNIEDAKTEIALRRLSDIADTLLSEG